MSWVHLCFHSLRVDFLGDKVSIHSGLVNIAKWFFKEAGPIYIPSGRELDFQLLHILANIW